MTAEEARSLRHSAEDEKVGHKNTFNLLVSDYVNDIERKIRKVACFTDAAIYSLKDLCNRTDVVEEIVRQLKATGFKVTPDVKCYLGTHVMWADLYITW
jgi:hypothetical protein